MQKRFGTICALDGVSVVIEPGCFFGLLGPSGCGKTTLLRIIAGLDDPSGGELFLDRAPILETPAHRRPVNTVFQSYALFPHLNVRENVAFGLRMKRVPKAEADRRVIDVLEWTRIDSLAQRRPDQLSGGQKQRVALARALVNEPRVLLLDEPLAALDLQLRRELRAELRAIQQRIGITFVFVTHDQEEALAMSDRIAVMRAGRIEQVGTGADLYLRPRNRFVAEFLGACNLFEARVSSVYPAYVVARTSFGELTIPRAKESEVIAEGDKVTVGIRPEHLATLPAEAAPGLNRFEARVERRVYTGAESELVAAIANQSVRMRIPHATASPGLPDPGEVITIDFPQDALLVFPEDKLIPQQG